MHSMCFLNCFQFLKIQFRKLDVYWEPTILKFSLFLCIHQGLVYSLASESFMSLAEYWFRGILVSNKYHLSLEIFCHYCVLPIWSGLNSVTQKLRSWNLGV